MGKPTVKSMNELMEESKDIELRAQIAEAKARVAEARLRLLRATKDIKVEESKK